MIITCNIKFQYNTNIFIKQRIKYNSNIWIKVKGVYLKKPQIIENDFLIYYCKN